MMTDDGDTSWMWMDDDDDDGGGCSGCGMMLVGTMRIMTNTD